MVNQPSSWLSSNISVCTSYLNIPLEALISLKELTQSNFNFNNDNTAARAIYVLINVSDDLQVIVVISHPKHA